MADASAEARMARETMDCSSDDVNVHCAASSGRARKGIVGVVKVGRGGGGRVVLGGALVREDVFVGAMLGAKLVDPELEGRDGCGGYCTESVVGLTTSLRPSKSSAGTSGGIEDEACEEVGRISGVGTGDGSAGKGGSIDGAGAETPPTGASVSADPAVVASDVADVSAARVSSGGAHAVEAWTGGARAGDGGRGEDIRSGIACVGAAAESRRLVQLGCETRGELVRTIERLDERDEARESIEWSPSTLR